MANLKEFNGIKYRKVSAPNSVDNNPCTGCALNGTWRWQVLLCSSWGAGGAKCSDKGKIFIPDGNPDSELMLEQFEIISDALIHEPEIVIFILEYKPGQIVFDEELSQALQDEFDLTGEDVITLVRGFNKYHVRRDFKLAAYLRDDLSNIDEQLNSSGYKYLNIFTTEEHICLLQHNNDVLDTVF